MKEIRAILNKTHPHSLPGRHHLAGFMYGCYQKALEALYGPFYRASGHLGVKLWVYLL